jgi:hypothetical protein
MPVTLPAATRSWSRAVTAIGGAVVTLVAALALTPGAAAQDPASPSDGLLDALAWVPRTAATSDSLIGYVDYRAVEAARPGALAPTSIVEVLTLLEEDDPAAERWLAATMGIASGPGDLLTELFRAGPSWPTTVGFDFIDIDRAIAFGSPPSNGTVLLGDFDPAAIETAYAARGYTSEPVDDHELLCSVAGCDTGLDVDLANRDPSVPFGGRLGREEPLVVSDREVLSSADIATIEVMLAMAARDMPAMADDPAFRAVATAPADDLTIIQATLLPPAAILVGADVTSVIGERATPEQVEAILAELDALEPLPAPFAVAIVDGATETEQVVTIALAYADEDQAGQAADVVSERLRTLRSLVRDEAFGALLDGRGVTGITTRVEPPGDGSSAAGVIEVRAPLAADEPDESGRLRTSSLLYRLFVGLIHTRDLLWLAPTD